LLLSVCRFLLKPFAHKISLPSVLKYVQDTSYDGIKIVDFQNRGKNTESNITRAIIRSIDIVKEVDSNQYNRLKKEIEWIVFSRKNSNDDTFISKDKILLTVYFDYWDDRKLIDFYYAGCLVYYTTRGFLQSKYTDIPEEKVDQILSICTQREKRFYRRIEKIYPEYLDKLVDLFIVDPTSFDKIEPA